MSAETRAARMAAAIIAREGEDVTHTSIYGTATACRCVIVHAVEPVLRDGQITMDDDHYRGMIEVSALPTEPQARDRIRTADSDEYLIDGPPNRSGALWAFALAKTQ